MTKPTNLETLSMDDLDAVSGGGREDWVGWGEWAGDAAGGAAGRWAGGLAGAGAGPVGMYGGQFAGAAAGGYAGGYAGGAVGGFAYDTLNGNGGSDWTDSSFDAMGGYTGY